MGEHSKIEWTESTWNPVTGCNKVSAGCKNCYAEAWAEMWRGKPGPYQQGFDLKMWPERLDLPKKWRAPRWVFVNSMSDLWHERVPDEFIDQVMATIAGTPHHYQTLTKRAKRMRQWARGKKLPANLWLGVTVENEETYERLEELAQVEHHQKWVSHEPLIGRIAHKPGVENVVDWVVVGGETGHGARRMMPEWEREIRQWCEAHNKPYFMKQWGEYNAVGLKVGRKAAGKIVEGRRWNQMPELVVRQGTLAGIQ